MKEHRCPKCNKLLFKYTDNYDFAQGEIQIETQHNCRQSEVEKVKDVKVFNNDVEYADSKQTSAHVTSENAYKLLSTLMNK